MTQPDLVAVLTTIQPPTECSKRLAQSLRTFGHKAVIVGDRKGPADYPLWQCDFLPLSAQVSLPLELARHLPTGHYVRKNLGYLVAISRGAQCIYETDDDNMPNDSWQPRVVDVEAQSVRPRDWLNVFRLFSDQRIWPRGFPLDRITDATTYDHDRSAPMEWFHAPVQQGLADLAPDVDAVWRLVDGSEFYFQDQPSVYLPPGVWCPFNSQSTWWWPEAYALMYLPTHCTFRMTDIWRSFVTQRCLWAMGHGMVFHSPEVVQERNQHSLIKDFEQEIPGYLKNVALVGALNGLDLAEGVENAADNMIRCYECLVNANIFPEDEMTLVKAWCRDVEREMAKPSWLGESERRAA